MLLDLALPGIAELHHVLAKDLDVAGGRTVQADDGPQQHRFPGSGGADDTEDLAAEHIEFEAVVDGLVAKPVDKAAHADDRLARRLRHAQICNAEKKIENPASVTMTRKIASTTESVVRRPTLSALPVT